MSDETRETGAGEAVPEPDPQTEETPGERADADRYTILEAFGLKFEVSNPRLAELLTIDAGDALSMDVRDIGKPEAMREIRAEAEAALPDVVIAPATAKDEQDAAHRRQMREEASRLGEMLGFTTHVDGVWESPTGVVILTRIVEKDTSFAGASHFVEEIAERRISLAGEDSTILFVVPDQQTADVFKVAIRQSRLYHLMRTISVDNLEVIAGLFAKGLVDHNQSVILLAPVADIDVGEILSVIRSAAGDSEEGA
jgi:hypothetical protein